MHLVQILLLSSAVLGFSTTLAAPESPSSFDPSAINGAQEALNNSGLSASDIPDPSNINSMDPSALASSASSFLGSNGAAGSQDSWDSSSSSVSAGSDNPSSSQVPVETGSSMTEDAAPSQSTQDSPSNTDNSSFPSSCKQICHRKEIRALSNTERAAYFDAIHKLNSGPKPTKYDLLVKVHLDNTNTIHGNDIFPVWHRYYLRMFEQLLQEIDPSICTPYWRWDLDSQAPEACTILGDHFYGGNGEGENGCVANGAFKDFEVLYPKRGCLSRKYKKGKAVGALPSTEIITKALSESTDYKKFRYNLELRIHPYLHNNIGGAMRSMASPSDPIFWGHHGFVDQIYWQWQQEDPSRISEFSGVGANKASLSLSSKLDGLGVTVKDAMDTRNLCYDYVPYQNDDIEKALDDTAPSSSSPSPSSQGMEASDVNAQSSNSTAPTGMNDGSSTMGDNAQPSDSNPLVRRDIGKFLNEMLDKANLSDSISVNVTGELGKDMSIVANLTTPGSKNDTSDEDNNEFVLNILHPVPALSDDFIKMNNYDPEEVKALHEETNNLVRTLNEIPGYISPCSLWNRPSIAEKLVKAGKHFSAYVPGSGNVDVAYDKSKSPKEIISQVKKTLLKKVPEIVKPLSDYENALSNAIGKVDFYNMIPKSITSIFQHPSSPAPKAPASEGRCHRQARHGPVYKPHPAPPPTAPTQY